MKLLALLSALLLSISNSLISDNFSANILTLVPELMKAYHIPGVAVATLDNEGKITLHSFGYADKDNHILVTPETLFQAGSLSKTLTAWGLMKLYQEGFIDLDSPVEKYLKNWRFPSSEFDHTSVTIRRLLSHTGGVSVPSYGGAAHPSELISLEESLTKHGVKIVSPPGKVFNYSGGGYALLQLVIEDVTGKKFEDFMRQEILLPLGMQESTFKAPIHSPFLSHPYSIFSQQLPNYLFTEKSAAGLYTTIKDLSRFVQAHQEIASQAKGSILSADTLSIMMHAFLQDGEYGLGYQIESLSGNERLVYHQGANRGWRAGFFILPSVSEGLAILTNSDQGAYLIEDLVMEWTKQHLGFLPNSYREIQNERGAIKGVTFALLAAYLFYLFSILYRWSRLKPKPFNWKNAAGISLTLLMLTLWTVIFYTPYLMEEGWIPASFMPQGFHRLSFMIIIYGVTYLCFQAYAYRCLGRFQIESIKPKA